MMFTLFKSTPKVAIKDSTVLWKHTQSFYLESRRYITKAQEGFGGAIGLNFILSND